jgi:signal peptidase
MVTGIVTVITIFAFVLGVGFYPVLSGSMAPGYPAGSVVITTQIPTEQIRIGDVVKLPLPNSLGESYIHRVVQATASDNRIVLITKGDKNVAADPWALEILSPTTPLVVASIPLVGHFTVLFSHFWVQLGLSMMAVYFVGVALLRAIRRPLE